MKNQHQALLKERARLLAEVTGIPDINKEFIDVITFSLAQEVYAIESAFVREVYPLKTFTTLPGTPGFVLGIINVRGSILSVLNLKKFFHLPEEGIGELNKVIIVQEGKMEFGILADVVHGTERLDKLLLQPPLPTISGLGAEFLTGISPESHFILNIRKILQEPSIIVDTDIN